MARKRKAKRQTAPKIRRGWGMDKPTTTRIKLRRGWGMDAKVTGRSRRPAGRGGGKGIVVR